MASRINALQVSPRGVSRWLALLLVLGLALGAISCRRGQLLNPNCAVNPETIDFGRVPLGGSADRPITISNSGSDSLAGTLTSLCSSYSVGNGRYSLAPGQSATLNLHFAANLVGEQDCAISTGLAGCTQIRAHAVVVAAPQCVVAPGSVEFGTVGVGQSSTQLVTIGNPSATLMRIQPNIACGDFHLEGQAYNLALAPGQSTQIGITFQPSFVGSQSCALTISASSGAATTCGPILLHGYGSAFNVRAGSLLFGDVPVGTTAMLGFTIINRGATALVGKMTASSPEFELLNSKLNAFDGRFVLEAGQQLEYVLRWSPTSPVKASCTVDFGGLNYGQLVFTGNAIPVGEFAVQRLDRKRLR